MTFYPSSLLSGHHHMVFDAGTNNVQIIMHICKMNKMQTDKSCTNLL